MNGKVLKSILPVFGIVIAWVFAFAGLRTFAGWVLGSGIFGAVPLAILTVIVVLAVSFVILTTSVKALGKVWGVNHQHTH